MSGAAVAGNLAGELPTAVTLGGFTAGTLAYNADRAGATYPSIAAALADEWQTADCGGLNSKGKRPRKWVGSNEGWTCKVAKLKYFQFQDCPPTGVNIRGSSQYKCGETNKGEFLQEKKVERPKQQEPHCANQCPDGGGSNGSGNGNSTGE